MKVNTKYSVTVVGLGKIGLPIAVQFARKGCTVFGADVNEKVVFAVNKGEAPFPGEKNLDHFLADVVERGLLRASTDTKSLVSESNVVVVVVPVYVDENGEPDFRAIDQATEEIGKGLRRNTLVSFETTLPVGTTRSRFVPLLECFSKLKSSEDFHVVFSPERVLTGRVFEDLARYPKLVGGLNSKSEEVGVSFYRSVLDFDSRQDLENGVWGMGSVEASEFAKLAETTYRDVNIALANQFALFAEEKGFDVYKVISAANSQPFSHIHQPGIAVGGHCIPIYPQMYLWKDPKASVVRSAREANLLMPQKSVEKLESIHGSLEGQKVGVLGASYRGGVKETAFSGVFPVVDYLTRKDAYVFVNDPLFTDEELEKLGFQPLHIGDSVDALIVQADHRLYANLKKSDFPKVRTILDGRKILTESNWQDTKFHLIGKGV